MEKELLIKSEQLGKKRNNRKTWKTIVSVLASIVVFCTTYALILPAITMEAKTYCGKVEHEHGDECYETKLICSLSDKTVSVEHKHTDECYEEKAHLICEQKESEGHTHSDACKKIETLLDCGQEESEEHTHSEECYKENVSYVCGQEESEGHTHSENCYKTEKELVCEKKTEEVTEEHVHTEDCYEKTFVCEKTEHKHDKSCYSDKDADVETASDWEKDLPEELTGVWADDVLAVADSQLGYTESTKNYVVDEDGKIRGYSRYGDWYGDSYGHWCAMFVSFCLNYAEVDEAIMPYDASCQNWIETLSEEEYDLYREAGEYEPVPGDLIFFNWDSLPDSDHVGFVYEIIEATDDHGVQIKTIEGNASDTVKYRTYDIDDNSIMGYGQLPKNPDETEEVKDVEETVVEEQKEEVEIHKISFEDEDGWMKAEATFEAGVLPEDAILTVGFVSKNEDALNEAISEFIKEEKKELLNTFLFTATFTDKDGNAIKAEGDVQMKITFDTPIELLDVQAMMFSSDETSTKVTAEWQYYLVDENMKVNESSQDSLTVLENNTVKSIKTAYQNNGVYALAAVAEKIEVEENEKTNVTYAINDEYSPQDVNLIGVWGRDVVTIAKSQIGYQESDEVSKFDQWAGNSSGTNNWNVNFVNYCLNYAGVSAQEIPWDTSYSFTQWQSALQDAGVYKNYTQGAAKVGDIVFVQGWNAGQNYNVGIIVEASANQYTIVFGDEDGNGRVGTQAFYQDWTQRILGYFSLSSSFEQSTGDYNVTVNCNKSDDIKEVIITLEDGNPDAATWTEHVNATVADSHKTVLTNHYLSIQLKNSKGEIVEPTGAIILDIEFIEPLSANLPEDSTDVEIEWEYQLVNNDTEVTKPQEEATITCDGKERISELELRVEHTDIYSFTALQLNAGDRTTYEVYSLDNLVDAFNAEEKINVILMNTINATELEETLNIGESKEIVLNLNGNSIFADSTVFTVDGGKLTIKDTKATAEETRIVGNVDLAADLAYDTSKGDNMVGRQATYNSSTKELTYYVTTSDIVNQNTGETKEQLVEHKVKLQGTISGTAGTSPVMEVKSGRLNINSGGIVDCRTSAITQSGGSIYLNGGYICGNRTSGSGGAIYSEGSGLIYQNDSVLAANVVGVDGGAIFIDGRTLSISGGVISGNVCQATGNGSGGGVFTKGSTAVKITGGYLTNNRCNSEDYKSGGGGIYSTNQSIIYLRGGYITGNYVGGGGGGVRTSASNMYVSGGFVNSNFAETAEGGGVTVDQPCVATISGGYINNNVSNTYEHWGGGGLFCANDSTLYITCVLVTENKAGGYGGGVAGCSTGRTFICEHNGGAIFDNKASEPGQSNLSGGTSTKNEDHEYATSMFLQYGYDDFFSAFNSVVGGTMLGGQPAYWTGSVDGVPVKADANDTLISSYLMGLTSHPTSAGKQAAADRARVFVNGNDSFTHGGGILCNGYMIIGDVVDVEVFARLEIFAKKALLDSLGASQTLTAGQFEFEVVSKDTGLLVATGTNDANGNIKFDKMIPFTEAGVYVYRVYEKQTKNNDGIIMDSTEYEITVTVERKDMGYMAEHIEKYRYEITNLKVDKITKDGTTTIHNYDPEDKDQHSVELNLTDAATFTNVLAEETNISVIKNWVGEQPADGTTIQVQLKRNGENYGDPVTLSASNSWSYDWGKLPIKETVDGEEVTYTYTVEELDIPDGYQVEYKTHSSSDSTELWAEASGTTLESLKNYIIVSADERYVLCPERADIVPSTDSVASITKHQSTVVYDGVVHDDYIPAASISKNSIFTAHTRFDNSGSIILKNTNLSWSMLNVSNGELKLHWETNANVYVGDTRITYNTSDTSDTTEYAIVFEDGYFQVTNKANVTSENATKLYVPKVAVSEPEIILTITNKKVNEEDVKYKLDITKVSASDNNIRLAGAHFELYYADENGEILLENGEPVAVTFMKATAGKYEYCAPDTEGATTDIVSDTITTFGGKLILSELPAGKYVLRETLAPNGYKVVTDHKITLGDINQPTIELFLEDERIEEEVFELPETGGSGTNVYTAGGILLLMISVLLYIKRKNQKKASCIL